MDEAVEMRVQVEEPPPPSRRRILRWIAGALIALAALLGAAIYGIDTGAGHRVIADRIAALKPSSGLRIHIGRIDGSIWRRATLRDVQLYDLNGRFFAAPEITLDWHPLRWTRNLLDIDRLAAPLVELDRLPKLRPGANKAILPGFDIHVGALAIDRLRLGPAVAGRAQALRVAAKADIRGRRARIALNASSVAGDRILVDLDAEPDGDRFRLGASLSGPAHGTIAGLIGVRSPVAVRVGGRGTWHAWNGTARADFAGRNVADLALGVREGRYLLSGTLAPSPFVQGKVQRLTAPVVRVQGEATLADRMVRGRLALASPALAVTANGAVDLATSRFAPLTLDLRLMRPPALFPNMTGRDVRLHVVLDGPFRTAAYRYALESPHIAFDDTGFDRVRAVGVGRLSKAPVAVPIRLHAAQVTGLGAVAGGILGNLDIAGVLHVDAKVLEGGGLALTSDKLKGSLGLRIDLVTGRYDVALTGGLARYLIPGLGIVDVTSKVSVLPGPNGVGSIVAGTGQAVVQRFDNAFLKSLAGGNPRIDTRLVRSPDGVLHFSDLVLTGPAIRITGAGLRRRDGSFQFAGSGTQTSYGPFRMTLDGMIDHPTVRLVLDRPVPALGLAQVALDLNPTASGFQFRAGGGSTLGRFAARGAIRSVPNGATFIDVDDLGVTGTHAHGTLRSDPGGFTGRLDLTGGGIAGTMQFAPQGIIQRIEPHLTFAGATLAASPPVFVRRGRLDGTILLDPAGTTIDGSAGGTGITRGGITLARASATAKLKGGRGTVAATLAGAGGRTFDLSGTAEIAPQRVTVTGQGTIEGRPLKLAGPAILSTVGDAWSLAPTRLDYAGGTATIGGSFGTAATSFDASVERMPMRLLDIADPSLGFGGYASGKVSYRRAAGAPPTGRIDVAVRGLTRSGLVLSSTPVDLGLAGVLTANGAAGRAVVVSGGKTIGRAQAKLGPLAPAGDLMDRLTRAALFAQLRYVGPADTLWRLFGVETIDLSGPISVAADIGGTPDTPAVRGTLSTDAARLESATTGTVISAIKAAGRFDGSRLVLDTMSGRAGGGTVSGTGSFTFGAGKGLGIDLSLMTNSAVLLNRDDIGATVTGPLAMHSTGRGGTISGDVMLERARFKLGRAAAAEIPTLPVTEINRPAAEEGGLAEPPVPWTLDIHARARNQLMVTGLGLDSEWRANLTIKGAITNPAIGGQVDLVRGGYQFAGRRFDLVRGMIRFTGEAPADPLLDITADANVSGTNATLHVSGTGLKPEINFASVPALPEDELLSRLLFGTSIANLSAPEALQLAAAVGA